MKILKANLLLILMILGVAIGIGFGVGMRQYDLDALDAAYLAFPGTMLIQGLKMLVIPLVVFSIIAGVSRLEREVTGKIGGYAVAYYALTTFLAVILGIILCVGIKPGITPGAQDNVVDSSVRSNDGSAVDTVLDIVRQLLPSNIVYALFAQMNTWRKVTYNIYDCSANTTLITNKLIADITDTANGCILDSKKFDLRNVNDDFNSTKCEIKFDGNNYYTCAYRYT